MVGELNVTRELYSLIIKKVDSTNPNKTLPGARFLVASENGSYSKEVVTGGDGTVTVPQLEANTYAVTELEAPEGYEIDNAGPQYVVLPNGINKTVTVTFTDTPEITGEGSIRKVDADDPTKGLAGAVIKITGVDNDFTGTYVTGVGGYLTDVPWKDMPLGSFTAEEVTPPEGYTKSPDVNKTKQTFVWDGKTDVALVFENDAKVKVKLIKLDDSDNPLPGAVFNILKVDVEPGSYIVQEVSAKPGFLLDDTPKVVEVKGSGVYNVELFNQPLGSLVIHKYSSLDRKTPLAGVQFKVTYAPGCVVDDENGKVSSNGIYYTGPDGTITINGIVGTVTITEQATIPGYTIDPETRSQTIVVNPDDVQHAYFLL